jgi:hypothetical protein
MTVPQFFFLALFLSMYVAVVVMIAVRLFSNGGGNRAVRRLEVGPSPPRYTPRYTPLESQQIKPAPAESIPE